MEDDDRVKELKAFEATNAGVKGLTDAGIEKVPRIFIRPADELVEELNYGQSSVQVPVIELGDDHEKVVRELGRASRELGIFQIVNHGVDAEVMDAMLDGVRRFHEQDAELKKQFHSRDAMQKVKYASNVDLYRSRAANWRDSLTISLMGSPRLDPDDLPLICRFISFSSCFSILFYFSVFDTLIKLWKQILLSYNLNYHY